MSSVLSSLSASPIAKSQMTVAATLSLLAIVFSAPSSQAAVVQAVIEIDGGREDLVGIILKEIERNTEMKKNITVFEQKGIDDIRDAGGGSATEHYTTFSNLFAAALIVGQSFTVHGNVTDKTLGTESTMRFRFHVETVGEIKSRNDNKNNGCKDIRNFLPKSTVNTNKNLKGRSGSIDCKYHSENQDDSNEEEDTWRNGRGGIFSPIVQAVEPYILSFINIIFHGILTSIVTKMMDNANMTGEMRLT